MKLLTLDVETTIYNDGDPFDDRNSLVCIGMYGDDYHEVVKPTSLTLCKVQEQINRADIIIGFNFKFDMHWLQRVGLSLEGKRIWDVQLAAYILSHQRKSFPSLNEEAEEYLGERKQDVIKTEYWEQGIDTDKVPWDLLYAYCLHDCELTYKIAKLQMEQVPHYQKRLMSLCMQDLVVLQEMEWNGLRFDRDKAQEEEDKLQIEKEKLLDELKIYNVPDEFNWSSTQQLSALLYGGKLTFGTKVPDGVWKSGAKAGQVRFRKVETTYVFPRRYTPIKGTETQKQGIWSTDEEALTKLGKDDIITTILRIRSIDKVIGTYLQKLPIMQDTRHWGTKYLHGQFNQTTTATGRLASSRPNLQNFPPEANGLIITRY